MARAFDHRRCLLLPGLLLLTLAIYQPAAGGGMLWDDDAHVTRPELRSAEGLWRIWTEIGAVQQYYPVVHSAFWLQHRLWGDDTAGYHAVNVMLHGLSAFLLVLVLRRLKVPGAELAGVLFAVHPVHVESVAWITELKNTLSGTFFLLALLAYLRFDERRRALDYGLAFAAFALALGSKTVTASLPGVLLVVFWWKRGSLEILRDVRPLVPFALLAVASGLVTAWVEQTVILARGAEFDLNPIERMLLAGRAIWFYLAKLVWPSNLIFTYPRWAISQTAAWQYLFPLGVAAALAAAWWLRARTRTPLAVMLCYLGLLFPALGFFNVYPFRFSFVADHFQYLASLPVLAASAAGLTLLASRWLGARTVVAATLVSCLGIPLGYLSWRQSHLYADAETLYRETLARNPQSWMAHVNLAVLLLDDRTPDAVAHIREALRLKPDLPEAHNNLGNAYARQGRMADALAAYEEARRLDPNLAEAHNNACATLRLLGRAAESLDACGAALRLKPVYVEAHLNLGTSLRELGRLAEALGHLTAALALRPGDGRIRHQIGLVHHATGNPREAVVHLQAAVRLLPSWAVPYNDLAAALYRIGRPEEALALFHNALALDPRYADAAFNMGNLLLELGQVEEAVGAYERALVLEPNDAWAHNNLGTALEALGRRAEAIRHYEAALRIDPTLVQARENLTRLRGRAPTSLSQP